MKKLIITTIGVIMLMVLCTPDAYAQRVYIPYRSQFGYGIEGGLNISRIGTNAGGKTQHYGYSAGITVDYMVFYDSGFYVESGLKFTTKGLKGKLNKHPNEVDMNAMYVQLPVYARYTYELIGGTRLFLKTGPYVAAGVGGKTKYNLIDDEGNRTTEKGDTFGSKGIAKRWDLGWAVGGGVEIGQMTLSVVGEHGFLNVVPMGKGKSRNLSLALGYSFR